MNATKVFCSWRAGQIFRNYCGEKARFSLLSEAEAVQTPGERSARAAGNSSKIHAEHLFSKSVTLSRHERRTD